MNLSIPPRSSRGAAREDVLGVSEPVAVDMDGGGEKLRPLPMAVAATVPLASLILWALAVRRVDVRSMDDFGLVGVLPVPFFVAVGLLTATFWWLVRRGGSAPLLALHLVVLAIVLHGLSSAIEPVPRLDAAWRHVGIADYVTRTHSVYPPVDAYFSWPGFFAFAAMVARIAGLPDAIALARWAPVFFELIGLPALFLVMSSLTSDRRRVWVGCWLFLLANWIGQDYFSPQAFSFFLYLAVLGLLLRHFRTRWWHDGRPPWIDRLIARARLRPERDDVADEVAAGPGMRAATMTVAIAACVAMVPTHQLTPFAMFLAVSVLVLMGRVSARTLPILIGVLTASWLAFYALPYVKGHLATLVGDLGDVGENVQAGVLERVQGSVGHLVVVRTRLALSGFVWLLAAFGAIRATRRAGAPVTTVALAAAPFALVVAQPYGGEILLRAYLFSLPFMAALGAAALLPAPRASAVRETAVPSWPRTIVAALLAAGLAVALVVSKYGNENGERFTLAEVRAVERLYQLGGPRSLLVATVPSVPWKARHYEWSYQVLSESSEWSSITAKAPSAAAIIPVIASEMRSHHATDAFVLIERAQAEYAQLLGLASRSWILGLERALDSSPLFEPVYRNLDAVVFRLKGPVP